MRKLATFLFSVSLIATNLVLVPSAVAFTSSDLTTCTDLESKKVTALKSSQKNCKPFFAKGIWQAQELDSRDNKAPGYGQLHVCTSKNPKFTYQFLKNSCPKFQISTDYWRALAAPTKPVIESAIGTSHDGATLTLDLDKSAVATSAPVAYYLVTNLRTGIVTKFQPGNLGQVQISGLSSLTSYAFKLAAVNVDGTSPISEITSEIRTSAAPVVRSTTTLAAPAFTLSSIAETKTVNNAISGYSITSSGGTIASYSISPSAPAGVTFDTSDGSLVGSPTSVASATAYTITATNASGSATRVFTLTVGAIVYTVGQTGPGGGKIFYFNADGFICGASYSSSCTYLEVGPSVSVRRLNWSNATLQNTSTLNSTGTLIGTGHRNTAVVVAAGAIESETSAIAYSDSYISPNGASDWFLPSADEMKELHTVAPAIGLGLASHSDYWTSSQNATTANLIWALNTGSGLLVEDYKNNRGSLIAPIRAG
ncbi:Putative Ig domain containing protein [Candidatus Nanopelagicaceae bacterium]